MSENVSKDEPEPSPYQKMLIAAEATLDLAKTYLEDGAPMTAAKHYREAAQQLEDAANYRNDFVAKRS